MATILAILLLLFFKSHALFLPTNSSISPLPEAPPLSTSSSSSKSFLKEILKAIAVKERWDPNGEVRISELDPISVRFGRSQRYEFHVRIGRTVLMLKFSDGMVSWRKPAEDWAGFGPDLDFRGGFDQDPKPDVRVLEVKGPLDLRAAGRNNELSLVLPASNGTYGGLRQILIGDDITVKVEGAQDVTFLHPHDIGVPLDRSSSGASQESNQFWPFGLPSCAPLLAVRVSGPASIVAFRTRSPEAYIRTIFHTGGNIEVPSEKCYSNGHFKRVPTWPFEFLSSELILLEEALRSFVGNSVLKGGPARLVKAKIKSSNLVKVRLEVERDITENDRIWKRIEAWRTKPMVERIWFEMVARVEAQRGWPQILVRKLTRPVMSVESSPWSNLMSNISFTQIPSILLPPEALTLDAQW